MLAGMAGPIYRFGPFSLDPEGYRLLREDEVVPLSPQPLDLLAYFVRHGAALATKEQLFASVWPDAAVTDNALAQAISELRRALGDEVARPTYIQTVPRRGYRFIAPVTTIERDPQAAAPRSRGRETSSLEAQRAYSEGRLRLESLDEAEAAVALDDFRHAIELDPEYAAAYVGLANAHFWLFEQSRYKLDPDHERLAMAIEQARCAIALDDGLAEAHATLSYVLAGAGQAVEAQAAARRAIALETDAWPHHYRLGNASWGEERLDALRHALSLYPDFPFAHMQIAMVHVARGQLGFAEQALRTGIAVQERQAGRRTRFPANGLHWLLGLLLLKGGDIAGAITALDRELAVGQGQLYAREYARVALSARGFALLQGEELDAAIASFEEALARDPGELRARLGMVLALRRGQRRAEAERELAIVQAGVAALRARGRAVDAAMLKAGTQVIAGELDAAVRTLGEMLTGAPPGPAGWSIAVEPLAARLAGRPEFAAALARLADRAR